MIIPTAFKVPSSKTSFGGLRTGSQDDSIVLINRKHIFSLFFSCLFFLLIPSFASAQVITIDAQFDDWSGIPVQTDPSGDASNLDFTSFSVTNDDEYLFLRFETAEEFGLINPGYTNSQVHIFIDTDNDGTTGWQGGGMGSELKILCGDKGIEFDYPQVGAYNGSLYDVGFQSAPTVTGSQFEIAISRSAKPDGNNNLFQGNTIRLYFYSTGNDFMPNSGSFFSYSFDTGPHPVYSPIDLDKKDPKHLRILAYNVERGGLGNAFRLPYFERMVKALDPDLIGFTEVQSSPQDVKSLMDAWIPINGGWHTAANGDNMIASRYPITFSGEVYPGDTRSNGALINLPDAAFLSDLLFITAHPSCCANDAARQDQIDKIAAFVLDAKSPGGSVTVPNETPIAIVGDFNLVGWRQQLKTLLFGEIQDVNTYGPGGRLDWDGSVMEDASCLHTETPLNYTWWNPNSAFSPGRLDYIFYSGSVMEEMNSYTLDTYEMPAATLTQHGLTRNDTEAASDHLPLVADFKLESALGIEELDLGFSIYPNPVEDMLVIESSVNLWEKGQIIDAFGRTVLHFEMKGQKAEVAVGDLAKWILFC